VLEAENAVFMGPAVSKKHTGFTGTGYLDFQNSSGDFVEWAANVASAGNHSLAVRYANGGSGSISVRGTVNGMNLPASLAMPVTGSGWTVWSMANFSANLKAGSNSIRLTTIGAGQPNVDHLHVD